jgi:predicted RND superfamily exporter protein
MKIIDQIENFLIDEYQCRTTYSINTAIKRYNRFKKGGHSKAYKLPETLEQRHIDDIRAVKKDLGLVAILSTDEKKCRIIGSINDIGSYEGTLRNEKLQHFIDGLDKGNLELYIAGKSHIFDQAVNRISSIFILLIGIGILVIGISILLLFRSMLYGIITIWVNLLPLGFALLMMILMGVDLNPASIFLLSILLGVALDDSIYLIGNVYRLSRKGKPNRSMIYESMRSNAFPLFITSLVIGLSFIALSISANHITSSFGLIMSTSLIFAFLTDLICLPALLLWITKD